MTDHERLCELLEGAVFANSDDHWDAQGIMRRLRSNGPDGLRVVPRNLPDNIAIELCGSSHPDDYGMLQEQWATALELLRVAGGERAD